MFRRSASAFAAFVVVLAAPVGARAAGASHGNTSSGNVSSQTSSTTSSNTSSQTTTYTNGFDRWAEDVYTGRIQGPAARAWLQRHPYPGQ